MNGVREGAVEDKDPRWEVDGRRQGSGDHWAAGWERGLVSLHIQEEG